MILNNTAYLHSKNRKDMQIIWYFVPTPVVLCRGVTAITEENQEMALLWLCKHKRQSQNNIFCHFLQDKVRSSGIRFPFETFKKKVMSQQCPIMNGHY